MPWAKKPEIRTESVVFNGYTYNRYPDSPRLALRRYYQRTGGYNLHRAVWEYHNGPIPDGYHVHHKDGNYDNNDISNLECLSPQEHFAEHYQYTSEFNSRQDQLDHLAEIRVLASEWHKSEEGREWHRQVSAKAFLPGGAAYEAKKRKAAERAANPVVRICDECGTEFASVSGKATLCGNACASRRYKRRKREASCVQS